MLILLVEDDADQLAVREMLLEHLGFDVLCAQTLDEALTAVQKQSPDYALVDLRLPDERTGIRLIRELKQMRPALRISVLTGSSACGLETRPERALIDEICQKGQTALPTLLKKLRAEQKPASN